MAQVLRNTWNIGPMCFLMKKAMATHHTPGEPTGHQIRWPVPRGVVRSLGTFIKKPVVRSLGTFTVRSVDGSMLRAWLAIIAHGKEVRELASASQTVYAPSMSKFATTVSFTAAFTNKHTTSYADVEQMSKQSGSKWKSRGCGGA